MAAALRQAGNAVAFLTSEQFGDSVRKAGFELLASGPGMMDLVGETFQRFPDPSFATPVDQQRFAFGRMFSDVRVEMAMTNGAQDVAAAWRPDMIVNDGADFVGPLVAASLGLPSATVGIGLLRRREWVELSTRAVARHWEAAGLDAPEGAGLHRGLYLNQWPLPLQRDEIAGISNVRDLRPVPFGEGAVLPEDLSGLGVDRPLVYVTFGTIFGNADQLSLVADGLMDVDVDVVVTVGPNIDPASLGERPDRFRVRRFVPQGALLPRCSLVITHGGAGSVIGALSHGVPLVVTPAGADQQENGERVDEIGVGRILPLETVTASIIGTTTRAMLDDSTVITAARRLAAAIAAMPSPHDTVPVIEIAATR